MILEAQHAYSTGRSVDTALHAVVSRLEGAPMHIEYAVGIFLDIEGAINNVRSDAVISDLDRFEVETNLKHLIYCLLYDGAVAAKNCH